MKNGREALDGNPQEGLQEMGVMKSLESDFSPMR
jgi:hypothetical protein